MVTVTTKLTNDILAAAIEGYGLQKKRIDDKIAEIRQLLGDEPTEASVTPEATVQKRKKFSAAARRKMAEAQRARWARIKGTSESPSPATPAAPKARRKISAEGLKRIALAQKERWRLLKAKAAGAPATVKKAAVRKAAGKAPSAKAAKKVAPVRKAAAKKAATKKKSEPTPVAVPQTAG